MSNLFTRRIDGTVSWSEVFCDAGAFLPLARAIFEKEGIPPPVRLTGLTPGTNAVFRAGSFVVKIFAPEESGFASSNEYAVERAALRFAAEAGVPVSRPVAHGIIEDSYVFRYILMEWVDAGEAGVLLPALAEHQQIQFVEELAGLLAKLNRKPGKRLFQPVDIIKRAINNPRLSSLPETLAADMRARAAAADISARVFVHGDLTGENVLIRSDGGIVLVDFADSGIA
ncbi:MAG: aminoglycoside phosphotransferase family protein, partial [Clostridia bacterium]|nr:aminoglycoside phosphotransferase family protein [Clostridia bacterium]